MPKVSIDQLEEISCYHKQEHEGYEYYKRNIVKKDPRSQCAVSIYEIPPKKSAYPYHYHKQVEEVFYIIKGHGILKTPEGEQNVKAGDLLYFPADEEGAHKLSNASESEVLVYIDFDTVSALDVAIYPDSNKIGVFGQGIKEIYKRVDQADYYEGE